MFTIMSSQYKSKKVSLQPAEARLRVKNFLGQEKARIYLCISCYDTFV